MKIEHKISRLTCIFKNEILLTKSKQDGYYFLPGGHIENNESPEQALIREIKEELNIDIPLSELKFISEFENSWINKNGDNHEVNYVYLNQPDNKFDTISQEDHIDFEWIPKTRLNEIDLRPEQIKEIIKNL